MHNARLLDHFQNPRHAGELPPPAELTEVMNPVCGDQLRLWIRWDDGVATEVRFKARGCTASIACGSALTELIKDRTRDEIAALTPADIETAVGGLIPESKHAAVLGHDALKAAVGKAR